MSETACTDRLCCRWQYALLSRIYSEGALTKHATVGEVMDKAEKPPLVRALVVENTGTGHAPTCKYPTEEWQEGKQ